MFTENRLLKTQELWVQILLVLGFFDSLNYRVQATAYSVRSAPAFSRA
jgi:hypothetical protein